MSEQFREWVVVPHDCIEERYKDITPPCHSWVVKAADGGYILFEPLEKEIAEQIVKAHNMYDFAVSVGGGTWVP